MQIPDTTTVTAEVDSAPSGYGIYIIDQDTGHQWGQCSLGPWGIVGTKCNINVGRGWEDNPNPQPLHLRAEVRGNNGYVGSPSYLTVDVQRREFHVDLEAEKSSIQIPDSTTVTATADRSVGGTGYYIAIINEDTGAQLQSCSGGPYSPGTGTTCTATLSSSWEDNPDPKPFHIKAVVQNNGAQDVASNTATTTIDVDPHFFSPGLSFPDHPDSTSWTAKATEDEPLPSIYSLAVEKHEGDFGYSCHSLECTRTVGYGTYRATIIDSSGKSYGESSWYTLDADGIHKDEIAGVDLVALAAVPGVQHLQTGLSAERMDQILAVGVGRDVQMPLEGRVLWGWRNGTPAFDHPWEIARGTRLLSLEEAVAVYHSERALGFDAAQDAPDGFDPERDHWPKRFLPFLDCQDRVAMDTGTGPHAPSPVYLKHTHDLLEPEPDLPSVGTLVEWWIEAFDEGLWRWDPDRNWWDYSDRGRVPFERRHFV